MDLEQDPKREDARPGEKRNSKPELGLLREWQFIEAEAQHNQHHGKADPVAMHVDLAIIDVLGFSVAQEGRCRLCDIALGRARKCGTENPSTSMIAKST